jgi:hypothetical protein
MIAKASVRRPAFILKVGRGSIDPVGWVRAINNEFSSRQCSQVSQRKLTNDDAAITDDDTPPDDLTNLSSRSTGATFFSASDRFLLPRAWPTTNLDSLGGGESTSVDRL